MFLFLKRLLSALALTMFITISLKAQSITLASRGKIGDRESNTLPGANAVVIEPDPTIDNEKAVISARTFTVEETKQYDGLFNNPASMVSSYALDDGPTFQKNLFIKNISLKSVAFRRALIAPVLFTAAGLSTLADDNDDNYEVQEERNKYIPNFRHRADDYLQHAPIMIVYGLNWLGVKGKNDFANRTAILIKSEMMVGILTFSLKRITAVPRPDTRELTSFPSGHTAQAFAAATFMAREYGHKNIWYSIGAYSVATGVGAMRVMNNRHWISDVMVGASIGILSTNLAYLTHQYRWGNKNKGNQTTVMPSYDGQTGMVNIIHRIN
jgi:membrane-associated phospholipid phosphatase